MPFFQNLWKSFFQSELDQLVEQYTKFAVHTGEFASKKKKDKTSPEKAPKEVTVWVAQIREGVTPVYYKDLLFVFLTQIQFHIHKETSSVIEATHKIVKKRRVRIALGHDENNGRILLANFSDDSKDPISDFWKKTFMELGALLAKNGVIRGQTLLPLPEIKRPKDLTKDINEISDIFNVNASGSSELISRQVVWNTSKQLWKAFLRQDVREKSVKVLFINFAKERGFTIDGISTTKVKITAHTGVLRLDCIMQFAPNQANENVISIGYNDQVDFFEKGPFLPDLADVLVKHKLLREQTSTMEAFSLNDASLIEQLNSPLDDDAFGSPEDLRLPPDVLSSSPNASKFVDDSDRHPAQEPAPEILPPRKSLEKKTDNNADNTTDNNKSEPTKKEINQNSSSDNTQPTNHKTQDSKPQEHTPMNIQEISLEDESDSISEYSKVNHVHEPVAVLTEVHEEPKPETHSRPLGERGREMTEDDLRKLVEREEQKWKLEEAKHEQEIQEQERLREAEEQQKHEQKMKNEIVQQKLQLELVDVIHQIENLVRRYGPLTETTVAETTQHQRDEYKQHLMELQDQLDNKLTMLTFQPTSLTASQSVHMEQLALQTLSTVTSQLAIIAQYREQDAPSHSTHHEQDTNAQVEDTQETPQADETTSEAPLDIGQTDEIDLNSPEPEVFSNEQEELKKTEDENL